MTYNWRDVHRDQEQGLQTGLIAQEVERVFPNLVSELGSDRMSLSDGRSEKVNDVKGVNYIGLILPMVKSIQDLHGMCEMSQEQYEAIAERVSINEREIASLKEDYDQVKDENAQLKKYLCDKDPEAPFCE